MPGKDSLKRKADVAKLVDALDLGSSGATHGGSSPSIRTPEPSVPGNFSTVSRVLDLFGNTQTM